MTKPYNFEHDDHDWDDPDCSRCWKNYPHRCKCGGLIHAEFFDTNFDDDIWLTYSCSECGDDYEDTED